jgi:hypothetical protein
MDEHEPTSVTILEAYRDWLRGSTTGTDPSEAPLDHPPAPDHGKACLIGAALDHLQNDVGPVFGPANEAASIAAVHVGTLDKQPS